MFTSQVRNWFGESECPGALTDFIANFHHENSIVPADCPWDSEDGQELASPAHVIRPLLWVVLSRSLLHLKGLEFAAFVHVIRRG